MATTRIIPLHTGKGRTVGKAISDIIGYVKNPEKTDHGRLITSYQCDSRVADAQFLLDKQTYAARTGRVRGADDVIAYHLRQSFVPGEITPEEANRLGVELARRFTKDKHAFIVCTHIDKAHVHNHIIWNSTTLECDRKFRNFWGSTRAVHRLSDTICVENGYSMQMATIELKDITKEYRSDDIITPALTNISLKINDGEFVAIMGASGSGKTTLLNIIGCMDVPTSGTYLLDNEDLGGAKEKRLSSIRGKKISFVFQNFALIGDYTVLENVEIPLIKQPLSKAERKKRVLSALELVGISNLAKKKPSNISGGQKQRVAIARAIVCGAETILADEPTGALDSKTGNEIMRVFSELNNMGKTVILITHDKNVASYAKRLITIQDGRILSDEGI